MSEPNERGLLHFLKNNRWVRLGLNILIFAVVIGSVRMYQKRNLLEAGETPAPDFHLKMLNSDKQVALSDLEGKKSLLFFFAPWCSVCKTNVPALNGISKDESENVEVLGIALAYDDVDSVKKYVSENSVNFPVLLGDGEMKRNYKVSAFPTTYLISVDGRIESSYMGYTPQIVFNLDLP